MILKLKKYLHSKGFDAKQIINFIECLEISFKEQVRHICLQNDEVFDLKNFQWLKDEMFTKEFVEKYHSEYNFKYILNKKDARILEHSRELYLERLKEEERMEQEWLREQDMLADAAWLGHSF